MTEQAIPFTEGPGEAYEPVQIVSGTLEKYEGDVLVETIVIENDQIVQVINHLEEN